MSKGSGLICIIPCGAKKQDRPSPAGQLYRGNYFTACRDYAISVVGKGRTFILSAKHGFLDLDQEIDPYNLRFGQPGSISDEALRQQAIDRHFGEYIALVLGGSDYAARTQGLFLRRYVLTHLMDGRRPLGVGVQVSWLQRHRGELPVAIGSLASTEKHPAIG